MPDISDLPKNILAQILYYVAASPITILYEWKYKLPLLAVCRKWTKLAINIVFNQVYVELAISPGSLLSAYPFWTSNAELLISRGYVLAARRLTIEFPDKITPECLQRIALEILKLDCVDWQHINALTITGPATAFKYHYIGALAVDDQISADIKRTMQYFGRNLRNIVELNLDYNNIASIGEYICSCFTSAYGGQLQIHMASMSISCSLVNFSRNIKVLELALDSSAARVLPSICGETLKVLKLDRVPLNFAWHHFRYDIFTRPIVFSQLTILDITFEYKDAPLTEVKIQEKIASGARSCDQLCFPALRQLYIRNCTPDCDLLYTDLPFRKLEKVYLFGNIDNIRHCSRLKLTWVRDLSVEIHAPEPDQTAEVYRVTNKLFTDICIGRTASLLFNVEIDPELIRWVNLTKLEVVTVDYATICKLIARLPNLAELIVHYLKFSTTLYKGFAFDESLYCSADPLTAWGEKLATLKLFEFNNDCSFEVKLDGVQALIRRTSALSKLFVPQEMEPYLAEFIDAHKDCYAHLANIQLF
ncbi:hypothetical protein GGI14_002449 [Coemansia sp. S680]|nr:hypothetical protein GGI14_002449 [Coemansia sp. S680]